MILQTRGAIARPADSAPPIPPPWSLAAKGQTQSQPGMENTSNFTTQPTTSGDCDPFLDDTKCVSHCLLRQFNTCRHTSTIEAQNYLNFVGYHSWIQEGTWDPLHALLVCKKCVQSTTHIKFVDILIPSCAVSS